MKGNKNGIIITDSGDIWYRVTPQVHSALFDLFSSMKLDDVKKIIESSPALPGRQPLTDVEIEILNDFIRQFYFERLLVAQKMLLERQK